MPQELAHSALAPGPPASATSSTIPAWTRKTLLEKCDRSSWLGRRSPGSGRPARTPADSPPPGKCKSPRRQGLRLPMRSKHLRPQSLRWFMRLPGARQPNDWSRAALPASRTNNPARTRRLLPPRISFQSRKSRWRWTRSWQWTLTHEPAAQRNRRAVVGRGRRR